MLEILFWILFAIVGYTYFGYAVLLFLMVHTKRLFSKKKERIELTSEELPDVCLFVTAYNELDCIEQKVKNSFALNYPKEKLQYIWVTDGSDDGSPEKLRQYPELEVFHLDERRGKMHAMNRGMQFVRTPIVIFSDSNTLLGKDSVMEIVREFSNPKVGCIAGEKRILEKASDEAVGSGESMYWKFESWIKKLDSDLNSAVGAVGELFAIRSKLFEKVEEDTLLDDFIISLRIAMKGYKIAYVPGAYAMETASVSVSEEMKRKIRIAAGGIQTLLRLKPLLNPIRFGLLSFQYISHKVLRWTIAPLALFTLLIVNFLILLAENTFPEAGFFSLFFYLQLFMYLLAMFGRLFEHRKTRMKIAFIPYYFASMNYAAVAGWLRFLKGKQSVKWEKAKRA
ncbi:MAG: glycosyl transferase [Bacteroidetes bacterium GWF2_42_66]|nr:MAG: glycosyl transferase [Bacteroidetes bacterium GWE2_42_39]OFY40324.1 MAG: glycosyl transferase [Bacteroidetes bacterium GWF2_42_66]HBL73690.1 glycosyl transferase [Prolixibacteraceae bacterium]HCU61411.1 glycosyl transferase [Prolixibacteraceae bacterium]